MSSPTISVARPLGLHPGQPLPRLYDRLVEVLRTGHYSRRTEEAYVHWIKRFLLFHRGRHPAEMCEAEIEQFLAHLAINAQVSASTQNQAFNALLFLYRKVLQKKLERVDALRAQRPKRLPLVLAPEEVAAVLEHLNGVPQLIARLAYGTGMRLMECLQLRVKDIDFQRQEIVVREGKGDKDRVTMLPRSLSSPLRDQLTAVRNLHEQDVRDGLGRTKLPHALARKYPQADRELAWQWVFPASSHFTDRETGQRHRHHLHETMIQKAFRAAVRKSGLDKPATFHVLRHAFATQLLSNHYDIRTVQELLGHKSVETTMIYTHVLNRGGRGVQSPLDELQAAPGGLSRPK